MADELDYDRVEIEGHRRRTMRDYLNWLARRAWVVVLTTVVGVVIGFYVFNRTPEIFRSMATIQIERQEFGERLDGNDLEMRLTGMAFVNTVAQKFTLPKFHQSLAEDQELHLHPDIVPKKFSFFSKEDPYAGRPVPGLTPELLSGIMPMWVRAVPSKNSNLLDIIVEHTDPKVAGIVANGLVEAYQKQTAAEMKRTSDETVDRVDEAMIELRSEISKLSKRSSRYTECLKTKELIDQTDLKIAQMRTRYGPKWIPFIEVKDLREELHQKFLAELEVVKSGDEEERMFWEAPDRTDADPVDELNPRVTLLESEMKTAELRLANMQAAQTQAQLDATDANEFSTQRYAKRGYKVGPHKVPTVTKFSVGGMMFGVGIVLLLGFLDPSARTVADLEGQFDLPILGAIPRSKEPQNGADKGAEADKGSKKSGGSKRGKRGRQWTPARIVTDHSPPAEAVRNLRAGLSFLGSREERRSFLFTSSLPGEGKSWVSANLAAAFGAQGDKTLIIDMDLRKPTLHRVFGMDRTPGFSDFLTQGTPLKEVFRKTRHKNVYLITAGTKAPNPSELLTLRNLEKLMSRIPEAIDRIIIDTAPVLAVRDALAPAKLVDSTIVVFKMAKTPVKALDRLLGILDANRTHPVGIVANELPSKRRKGYGYYGDYYYGYHSGGEYYGEEDKED